MLKKNKDGRVRELLTKLEESSLKNANESPVLSFLHREMTNALALIAEIHHNLGSISKLLRGTQVLTQEMNAIVQSLLRGETPSAWLVQWSTGPEENAPFCSGLISKTQALFVSSSTNPLCLLHTKQ